MFKLPAKFVGKERANTLMEIKQKLETLPALIESIKFYRVGVNYADSPAAFELVIDSDFESKEGLKFYSIHPEHQKVVAFLRSLDAQKAVVDYEY